MLRFEYVATPPTAAIVSVPESCPPLGFVPIATVTFPVNAEDVFPNASCAATFTDGLIDSPAVVVVGCCVNASFVGAPARMLNA